MKHYLINITWRCQNNCPYCWLNDTVRQRTGMMAAPERSPREWIAAIRREWVDTVDIAGGEPLLYEGLLDILDALPRISFGISTNGQALEAIDKLCAKRRENVICVNLSLHPQSELQDERTFKYAATMLHNARYPLICNLLDWGDNIQRAAPMAAWLREHDVPVVVSPFEDVTNLGTERATGLRCKGGTSHLTLAADGAAWPCLTALRSPYWREWALGNWVDDTIDLGKRVQPCYLDCTDYYVLKDRHAAGDMWGVEPREVTE